VIPDKRLRTWRDWYRFARETLAYEELEATEYATLRFVEEQNRAQGDCSQTGGRSPSRSG
jgi:hypothetical protein